MFKLVLGKGEEPEIKLPTSVELSKKQEIPKKKPPPISALLIVPVHVTVWITINWKILIEMGIPEHRTCHLRNLYADQEATIRTVQRTSD